MANRNLLVVEFNFFLTGITYIFRLLNTSKRDLGIKFGKSDINLSLNCSFFSDRYRETELNLSGKKNCDRFCRNVKWQDLCAAAREDNDQTIDRAIRGKTNLVVKF